MNPDTITQKAKVELLLSMFNMILGETTPIDNANTHSMCLHCRGTGYVVEQFQTMFGLIRKRVKCTHCNEVE